MTDNELPLEGLRVLEVAEGIAGGYCGKLLNDLGAEVVKVEGRSGDPLRARAGLDDSVDVEQGGGLFRYLNGSKRSIALDLESAEDRGTFLDLVAGSDIVVGSSPSDVCTWDARAREEVRAANPWCRVVVISPFGLDGPSSGAPSSDLTLQALCGSMDFRRSHTGRPVAAGGELSAWMGGVWAAIAALLPRGDGSPVAYVGGRASCSGELIDVSLLEAAVLTLEHFSTVERSFREGVSPAPNLPMMPTVVEARDGWVHFTVQTPLQWQAFVVMIGQEEVLEDRELSTAPGRHIHRDRMQPVQEAFEVWASKLTVEEILTRAAAARVPAAPLTNGETVTEVDHFQARGIYVPSPDGGHRQPLSPFHIDGRRGRPPGPAPLLDEHRAELVGGWPSRQGDVGPRDRPTEPPVPVPVGPTDRRLHGLRVIEFGSFWAGPVVTAMLAALGADVVKVESVQRFDLMRLGTVAPPSDPDRHEKSPIFATLNLNKRGVTIDLGQERGRELARRLVSSADVVFDSYAPRVLEGAGLDYDPLVACNPSVVLVRQPAFGLSGPWRDRPGFAPTMENVSGLSWITGYPDELPRNPNGPCDPMTGFHSIVGLLAVLEARARRQDKQPVHLEVSMVEVALNVAAESVIEFGRTGIVMARDGNRSHHAAPQGMYQCGRDGLSVCLSVGDEAAWSGLKEALGHPAWMDAEHLAERAGRRHTHDELDRRLEEWLADQDAAGAVARLLSCGVPAAVVATLWGASEIPQLRHRGFFEEVDHPVAGKHEYPGFPLAFPGQPGHRWFHRPAPTLGRDNTEVLTELASVGEKELDELERDGVIGTRPVGQSEGS